MSMRRADVEWWSFRAALGLGFCVTVGLWLYTGYAFDRRIENVRRESSDVSARYLRAQELLASVRAQVVQSAVRVRDALLEPQVAARQSYRDEVAGSRAAIDAALREYRPLAGTSATPFERLSAAIDQFYDTAMRAQDDSQGRSPVEIRDVLNNRIGPRRAAALAISEELQALNREAFIRQQQELADLHGAAEMRSRRQLGLAFAIGLGVVLATSLYAGRLDARLRDQMERDARISLELQQTAAKILNAQEEERRTIARELHDEVGQVLTAIRVELDVAQRAIESAGGSAAPLAEAQTITDGALATVRNLTQLLHPAALDDLGLPTAIEAALRGIERRHHIRVDFRQTDLPPRLPRDLELAAYRIVQEAVTNVVRHAKASTCEVRLTHLKDRLLIEIEDDGVGFVEDIDRPILARGLGLVSIRERAARLGGTFNILSSPGSGTRLIVNFPEKSLA